MPYYRNVYPGEVGAGIFFIALSINWWACTGYLCIKHCTESNSYGNIRGLGKKLSIHATLKKERAELAQ